MIYLFSLAVRPCLVKQFTESQSCEESVWLYYNHLAGVTPPKGSVPGSLWKEDLDTVRVWVLGSGFGILFAEIKSLSSGASYFITLGEEVTNAFMFVFTTHITHCRESCSRGLLCRVLESREEKFFSQEWVKRNLVYGILIGAIAPCLCTVIYCSL